MALLRLTDITKTYFSGESGEKREVLKGVSFTLGEGERLAVTGPSGSGKSTLLHLIGLLDKPDAGEITFRDRTLNGYDERERDLFRNREIGFVFQLHYLLPQYTTLENVMLPAAAFPDVEPRAVERRARLLLERVGLIHFADAFPGELSGGERQRAALVRALINRPSLLLADEPTGSLDHATALSVAGLLREFNREERTTLIVVTHAEEIARGLGRVLRLEGGRLRPVLPENMKK
jgi:lipoprotein-releasing system ATP-binding protein